MHLSPGTELLTESGVDLLQGATKKLDAALIGHDGWQYRCLSWLTVFMTTDVSRGYPLQIDLKCAGTLA